MNALATLKADVQNELNTLIEERGDVTRIITNLAMLDIIERIDPADLVDLPFSDWPGDDESPTVTDSVTGRD